jgi:murein DD-endopeptidase MepM/ murein hydrolase activator NlpD
LAGGPAAARLADMRNPVLLAVASVLSTVVLLAGPAAAPLPGLVTPVLAAPVPAAPVPAAPADPSAPVPSPPAIPQATVPAAPVVPSWPVPGPGVPRPPATRYRWPVAGVPVVTRPFAAPPEPWLAGHRGVDLGGTPGAQVLAAGPGVVAFAGTVAGVGVVSVDHAGGLRTTYEPVAPLVPAGAQVVAGQPVGSLLPGHPGCPQAACLHWGLRRGADYLDPLLLLRLARMRLYPVDRSG